MKPECICGDARAPASYQKALQGERAALLFTDPPYCLLTRRRKGGDLRQPRPRKIDQEEVMRFESVREYRQFTEAWLPLAVAQCAKEAPLIIWTNVLGKEPILQVSRALGYGVLNGEFIWGKRTTQKNQSEYLLRVYELALLLTRTPLPPLGPADPPRPWSAVSGYDDGEGDSTGGHAHHKPFSALEGLIRTYSRPGDLILDPFAGSGSIPAAALRLKRRAACIEARPEWAMSVTARLQAL